MSKRFKWILAILIGLGLVLVANATELYNLYMPLVYMEYPTQTPTKTAKPTKTPTITPTPAPGACLSGKTSGVCITNIDYKPKAGGSLNESISIKNLDSSAVDMQYWRIVNDKSEKFIFPKFSLSAKSTVKVWTKVGTDDANNLYMDRDKEFWGDTRDCAYLKDDSDPRKTIDEICYGLNGLFYVPRLDAEP